MRESGSDPLLKDGLSQCRVKMQVIFGLPSAMQHVFVKGSGESQALEPDCEISHYPEG